MRAALEKHLRSKYSSMLSTEINAPISMYPIRCDDGWSDLIGEALSEIRDVDANRSVIVNQIKEKFGTLCIYFSCEDPVLRAQVSDIVSRYSERSSGVCELCGNESKIRRAGNGRLKSLCSAHNAERDA